MMASLASRYWLGGACGLGLVAAVVATACSSTEKTPDGSDDVSGGSSGTGTGGGAAGGSGGTGGTGTSGASGSSPSGGSAGSLAAGTGGSGTSGAAGAGGTAGSSGATGGGAAGAAGNAGTSGAAGAGGTAGSSGAAGGGASGSAGAAWSCPTVSGNPLPSNPQTTQVQGVPPAGFGTSSSSNVEGPVWIAGSLYVSHIQEGVPLPPPARILKVTGTTVEEFVPQSGSNGLAVNALGNIVAARHTAGDIATLNLTTKTFTPLVAQYMSARFDSPNDLAIRRDGNLYFSDPDYQAPTTHPQTQTRVYRVSPQGAVTVVDAGRNQPNGVTLSVNENTLYVSTPGGIFRYTLNTDGSVMGAGAMMNGLGMSDGMAMDCAGNLYLTQERDVVVVGPAGTEIGRLMNAVPNGASTTNVAFGGANHQRLFITARGNGAGLWYIDLTVPGLPY